VGEKYNKCTRQSGCEQSAGGTAFPLSTLRLRLRSGLDPLGGLLPPDPPCGGRLPLLCQPGRRAAKGGMGALGSAGGLNEVHSHTDWMGE
jgi:hypothetical protein